jgi:hypothetical protein
MASVVDITNYLFVGWVQGIEPHILGKGLAMENGGPTKRATLSNSFMELEASRCFMCNLFSPLCKEHRDSSVIKEGHRGRSR